MDDFMSKAGLVACDDQANATLERLLGHRLRTIEAMGILAEGPLPRELLAIDQDDCAVGKTAIRHLGRELLNHRKEYPIAALLLDGAIDRPTHAEEFDTIVSRSLQVAIGLAGFEGNYAEHTYVVCRRAYRLKRDEYEDILALLPNFAQPLTTVADKLEELSQLTDPRVSGYERRLGEWAASIRTFVDHREKHTVTAPGNGLLVPGDARRLDLDPDGDLDVVIADSPVDSSYPNAPEETRHDRPKEGASARIQGKSDVNDCSDGIGHLRGEQILNRQLMHFASPSSHPSRLTRNEALKAFQYSYDRAQTSSGYLFAALSILTGRLVSELVSLKLVEGRLDESTSEFWFYRNRTLGLYFRPELPQFKDLMKLGLLELGNDAGLVLPIPPKLATPLLTYLRRKKRPGVEHDLTQALAQLKQAIDHRITGPRLSKCMKHRLTSKGIDEVDVALLTGTRPEHCAGLYYSVAPRDRLATTFYEYEDWLLQKHADHKRVSRPPLPKGIVGSRIRIPPGTVGRYFNLMADAINEARENLAACDIFEFHNRYLIYTEQLLSLCTAIRSVTEPFGNANDINVHAGTVRLSDKVNRESSCHRLVPIGATAIDQVNAYFDHLSHLHHELRDVDPELAAEVSQAILGKGAWLFCFDRRRKVRTVVPKWILTQLRHTWPLPANWPRHFLSTELRGKGFARGVVRAFLGHSDLGPAPLSHFDGVSMFELRQVGAAIEDIVNSLNIGAVNGWNTNF
jgi:integrase